MDRANYALASHLSDHGYETHLVTYRADADLAKRNNVVIHKAYKPASSDTLGEPLLRRLGRHWSARISARGGIVIANGGNCSESTVNWVHYLHCGHPPEIASRIGFTGLRRKLRHRLVLGNERQSIPVARAVIANSRMIRAEIIARLKVPDSQVNTIYYGIDRNVFRPASAEEKASLREHLGWRVEKPVVAFVGELGDRRKGFHTLFGAWRRLCAQRGWDADLKVVGRGMELPKWKAQTAQSGMSARIDFLGFRDDVPTILRASDAMVAPTRYEPYGLAVHESLCCGLPAFVSADSGVAERYPAQLHELLLPNPTDIDDLVARLRNWRANIDAYRAAVEPLSNHLRSYTWRNMADDFISLIQ